MIHSLISFNSRPHKEVDNSSVDRLGDRIVFQFTTSQGGRPSDYPKTWDEIDFQFTTSQGGRPCRYDNALAVLPFQFTTSQGGRRGASRGSGRTGPFNSRPHKEVDSILDDYYMPQMAFQFTTSQGGRLHRNQNMGKGGILSIHDLTRRSTTYMDEYLGMRKAFNSRPHKEVDLLCHSEGFLPRTFQFTTSQGGRRKRLSFPSSVHSFNSRPHKEVDDKSVGFPRDTGTFNSRPHKEVDGRYHRTVPEGRTFNSRPHKEVDDHSRE